MTRPTLFSRTDSVEVWDAEFRWREFDGLRDTTIDDTWRRVAEAAAVSEGAQRSIWALRYAECFSCWRLLPGADLLRSLGTRAIGTVVAPAAVLNAAVFTRAAPNADARFDHGRFAETAALAVRFLDDVAVRYGAAPGNCLRLGLIGLADALRAIGCAYDSVAGRDTAQAIARSLAAGSLRGSIELARERGGGRVPAPDSDRATRAPLLGLPDANIDRLRAIGARHVSLTALDRHPLLARLANGVADAFDPLPPGRLATGAAERSAAARREMARCLQRWIDSPIMI